MDGLKRDPIEQTAEYLAVIEDINKILDSEFPRNRPQMGSCYRVWARKKQLLASCGIMWKSPDEMNQHVLFD